MKFLFGPDVTPQWGAADAAIKVPYGENTELKRSPSKAVNRSVYSHLCYAYCQGFIHYFFQPFGSIHVHFFFFFFRKSLPFFVGFLFCFCFCFFPALAVANTGSCVGLQNKIGHPARVRFPGRVPAKYN